MLQQKFDSKSPASDVSRKEWSEDEGQGERNGVLARIQSRIERRHLLMMLGPLVVLAGVAYFVITGGRYESTDNAYVKADKVMIAAEVSGRIVEVAVKENQHVEKGDLLFRIDDRQYKIALAQAEAQLATVRDEITSLKASYNQKQQELALARSDVVFAEKEFDRQKQLVTSAAVSQSKYDSASHDLEQAQQKVQVIEQELAQTLAALAGNPDIPIKDHPRYQAAMAARDKAALDLSHTRLYSPLSGTASNTPDYGQWVTGSSLFASPVMSVVGDHHFWIEANLKETQLEDVKPGLPVSVKIDAFPGNKCQGHVESVSGATGAEFSVIPPQNASGNWVKVVQRVPVRISVDNCPEQLALRTGLSASVKINTQAPARTTGVAGNSGQPETSEQKLPGNASPRD